MGSEDTALCYICMQSDPAPISSGCNCLGGTLFAHPCCLLKAAYVQPWSRKLISYHTCTICKGRYSGPMDTFLSESLSNSWNVLFSNRNRDSRWAQGGILISSVFRKKKEYKKCEEILQRLISLCPDHFGVTGYFTFLSFKKWVKFLFVTQRYDECANTCMEVLNASRDLMEEKNDIGDISTLKLFNIRFYFVTMLSKYLMQRRMLNSNGGMLRRELKLYFKTRTSYDGYNFILKMLVQSLISQEKYEEAAAKQKELIEILKIKQVKEGSNGEVEKMEQIAYLPEILSMAGKNAEAAALRNEILPELETFYGEEHDCTMKVMQDLTKDLVLQNNCLRAEIIAKKFLRCRGKKMGGVKQSGIYKSSKAFISSLVKEYGLRPQKCIKKASLKKKTRGRKK